MTQPKQPKQPEWPRIVLNDLPCHPVVAEAIRLCRAAGEDPSVPRWTAYLEQARATLEAKKACSSSSSVS